MKKLNVPLLVFHSLGALFFIFSFQKFRGLYYLDVFELATRVGISNFVNNSSKYGYTIADVAHFTLVTGLTNLIAILFAFVVSLFICIKRKYSIFNSIVVLLLMLVLIRIDILKWIMIDRIPGYFIRNLFALFLVGGLVFLFMGIVMFTSKRLNRIVAKYNKNGASG